MTAPLSPVEEDAELIERVARLAAECDARNAAGERGDWEGMADLLREIIAELTWRPIREAPKDGTHILACWQNYSATWTFDQAPPCVVHYWANPGEEGFYNSLGDTEEPLDVKWWQPLSAPPRARAALQALQGPLPLPPQAKGE